jgi:hypothetical protein
MSLGQYDFDERERRLAWLRILKIVVYVVVVISVGLFSYQYAIERVKGRESKRDQDLQALTQQNAELQVVAQQYLQASRTAEGHARTVEERLGKELPSGDRAKLLKLVDERLAAGIQADRLALLIRNARAPTNCAVGETRHLVAATSARLRTSSRAMGFANGALTLTAEGEPVRDRKGNAEGWYDPAQPVTVKIAPNAKEPTAAGVQEQTVSGVLPLNQTVIVGNHEYHFAFKVGTKSYIDVAVETCDFP